MQKIVLGRNGNQPFEITGSRVSREHAEIVIDDNNVWTLKDLNSTTGTFVRDEDTGMLKQIYSVTINPMTFICLGPDNSSGCFFYARHVLTPGNYNDELAYMNKKEDEAEEEIKKIEKTAKNLNLIKIVLPFVLFVISLKVFQMQGDNAMIIRMLLSSLPSGIIQLVYNPARLKKKITEKQERFHHCPNPTCSRKMKVSEIRDMDCIKCHCQ